ncbi:MAG: site-specific DNA-methyltransferase [Paludibacteraceae bacterium]|nr:site-specific DNA-methyltransferase [Paludibacteraceae bacterium]
MALTKLDIVFNAEALEQLKKLPGECIDCCVTSPPYYGLRDYGHKDQIGLEETPEAYVQKLVAVFHEIKRCMKPTGTLWLNLGDSYSGTGDHKNSQDPKNKKGLRKNVNSITKSMEGYKPKDLIGIPWMTAFSLRADGWYLRQDIIWHKPNPMPEGVTDRCTKSHEYIFLLTKSARYYFDHEAIQEEATGYNGRKDTMNKGSEKYYTIGQKIAAGSHEHWKFKNLADNGQRPNTMHLRRAEGMQDKLHPVRNKRDVWTVATKPSPEAHYAMYPETLVKDCILAGCPEGGVVYDPFMGSGTTACVARKLRRHYIGTELNPDFHKICLRRIEASKSLFDLE